MAKTAEKTVDMKAARAAALIDEVGRLQADKRDLEDEIRSAKTELATLVPALAEGYPARVDGTHYTCTVSEVETREITAADIIREVDRQGLKGPARSRILNEVLSVRMGKVKGHKRLGTAVADRLSQIMGITTRVLVKERR